MLSCFLTSAVALLVAAAVVAAGLSPLLLPALPHAVKPMASELAITIFSALYFVGICESPSYI
jgi:hypothetical protein